MAFPCRRALTKDGKMPCIVSAHSDSTKRNWVDEAKKADGGGIGREEDFKATASNPRGLDARAFTKKTGAPDECALDTS